MELQIYRNTSIKEITEQFCRYFPFLKLEFFVYRHGTDEDRFTREVYRGLYLEETSEFFKEGMIHFAPSTTVEELEQAFQMELGLAVKIYRRSGDMWVDTTQTGQITLAKQNSMGAALARPVRSNIHTLFL